MNKKYSRAPKDALANKDEYRFIHVDGNDYGISRAQWSSILLTGSTPTYAIRINYDAGVGEELDDFMEQLLLLGVFAEQTIEREKGLMKRIRREVRNSNMGSPRKITMLSTEERQEFLINPTVNP
jgi:hypothetical protein